MNLLLLSIVAIQLLACNKLLSEGKKEVVLNARVSDTPPPDYGITSYRDMPLMECVGYTVDVDYTAVIFTTTNPNTRNGLCQIILASEPEVHPTCEPEVIHSCEPNPCQHHGVCTPQGHSFDCSCLYPTGGATCEDLVCESCARQGDLVLSWNITMPSTTWAQSYEYCKDRGMNLFIDNSPEKHEFAASVARQLFPDINAKVAFWIGMYRTRPWEQWTYIDGTPVSRAYRNWAPFKPMNELCAVISNGQRFDWKWDDEDCSGNQPGWSYYPLCEVTFPFLAQ